MRSSHEYWNGAVTILNIGRCDDDGEHESEDVNKDMTLAPVDLFFPHRSRQGHHCHWI
jgi:hypothetical protein